jgi:hypothetical protein
MDAAYSDNFPSKNNLNGKVSYSACQVNIDTVFSILFLCMGHNIVLYSPKSVKNKSNQSNPIPTTGLAYKTNEAVSSADTTSETHYSAG